MISSRSYRFVLLILLVLFLSGQAQVPRLINYQGKLSDKTGTPLTGDHNFQFLLYTVIEAGSPIWQEIQNAIPVSNGYFHTLLGAVNPLPAAVFDQNEELYLEIVVDGETLGSRFQLTSVAYAFKSAVSDSAARAEIADSAPPSGSAAGDLSGSYPAPVVKGIQGRPVSASGPGTGQVLKWNNSQWTPADDQAGGAVNVSARISGTGESDSPLDIAQQGATSGQVLEWSGTTWAPGNKSSGDITAVTAGNGLTGGGTSGNATLNVGAGSGITVNTNAVAMDTSYTNGLYVNESQANSVTQNMIVAEPGFAFTALSNYTLSDQTTNQTVGSITITAPAAGYVVAQSTGYIEVNHTTGTSDNIFINLLTNPSGTVQSSGAGGFAVPSPAPTYWLNRGSFACQNMFSVSAGQNLTIYLVIRQSNGANIGSTWVGHATIQAVFYTTQY